MSIAIRSAVIGDVAAVLAFWQDAGAEPTHTDTIEDLTQLVQHDPAALLVAVEEDGRIVGSVIAGWDGWRGSIYRLAVAPERRRARLGQQLLAAAEARLRVAGAVRSHAIVVETDPQAVAFWQTSGWQSNPERLRFVHLAAPGE